MKLSQKLIRVFAVGTLLLAVGLNARATLAAAPHEDPGEATVIFSGVALFDYYSATLALVHSQQSDEVESRMDRMPFANLPPGIQGPTDDFAAAAKTASPAFANINSDIQELKLLSDESRFDEALHLIDGISAEIGDAQLVVNRLERAAAASSIPFKVRQTAENSSLTRAYNNLQAQIGKLREQLDFDLQVVSGEKAKADYRNLAATRLSLVVHPTTAFVGDSIAVSGALKSVSAPLAARDVDLLVDSSRILTMRTDSDGNYAGTLQIPYHYIPQMEIRALYHPQGDDVGVYLASLSDSVDLEIQFYKAVITVLLDRQAYPGRKTTVSGRIDYGNLAPPAPAVRLLEVALDNATVAETGGATTFSAAVDLPSDIEIGDHVLTVSVADDQRYATSFADAKLNVAKAQPSFSGGIPGVLIIPGSFAISGKVQSELGPMANSNVTIKLADKSVSGLTGDDGTFKINYQTRMGWGLIGSDSLKIHAVPNDPWNKVLDAERKVIVINAVNCGLFLGLIAVLSVVASRRPTLLRRRSKKEPRLGGAEPGLPTPAPVYTTSLNSEVQNSDPVGEMEGLAPRDRTLFLYRILIKLAQRTARVMLRPQQTIREFAAETARALGPLSGRFLELTGIVEKILYSAQHGTLQDTEKGEQLAQKLKDGLKE